MRIFWRFWPYLLIVLSSLNTLTIVLNRGMLGTTGFYLALIANAVFLSGLLYVQQRRDRSS